MYNNESDLDSILYANTIIKFILKYICMEEGAPRYHTVALPLLLSLERSKMGRTWGKLTHLDAATYVTVCFLWLVYNKSHGNLDF